VKQIFLMIGFSLSLLFFPPCAAAQNTSRSSTLSNEPYLIPQTIFVGDQGRLVVPLSQIFAGAEPFVWTTTEELPDASPDLVITRIELERRAAASRLLIDFIPFMPGILSLPSFEILSGQDPIALNGLKISVASILNPNDMALSLPASALAVPGTSFLIYGTIILVLVILFLGIGGSLWGRRHFRELWEKFRRRYLLRAMTKFLRRLEKQSAIEKNGNPGYYLSLLSTEFREFLSLFTGFNCRPLTAGEFLELELTLNQEEFHGPAFLCRLFRNWDALRFSGRNIAMDELFHSLKETEGFIAALDRAERERPSQKFLAEQSV